MSEQPGYPIQAGLIVLTLVGGGWYFLNHYEIEGLDTVSFRAKEVSEDRDQFVSFSPNRSSLLPESTQASAEAVPFGRSHGDTSIIRDTYTSSQIAGDAGGSDRRRAAAMTRTDRYRNLRIASWALGGFGPSKLANDMTRKNLVRILRQFDVIALQQIHAVERDVLPRLIDTINEGQSTTAGVAHYDFILSHPSGGGRTGTASHGEQMAFVFDTTRVEVDRTQTYTLSDPADSMVHDPVVAWFRATEPDPRDAFTFSLVNVRIELTRAKQEVALLPGILASVHDDGRGEDDVLLAGLFQADDAYLLPSIAGRRIQAAVRSLPTDVLHRQQTSNILVDAASTSEFLGRGGPLNFLRAYNLTVGEAEAVSPHVPVYAEFTAVEGGHL